MSKPDKPIIITCIMSPEIAAKLKGPMTAWVPVSAAELIWLEASDVADEDDSGAIEELASAPCS